MQQIPSIIFSENATSPYRAERGKGRLLRSCYELACFPLPLRQLRQDDCRKHDRAAQKLAG